MVVDLSTLGLLVIILIVILLRQFASFGLSISLFASALITKIFGQSAIDSVLNRYQVASDRFVVSILFLFVFILVWGAIYALISNAQFLESRKIPIKIISAIFFATAFGLIGCSILNEFVPPVEASSQFCSYCSRRINLSSNILLLTNSNEEVVALDERVALADLEPTLEAEALELLNQARIDAGKKPVAVDEALERLSREYAASIVESSRLSHQDQFGQSPAERANSAGVVFTSIGENLAIASNASAAHNAFMNSRRHQEIMLNDKFFKVGIGVYRTSDGSIILVEEFTD